MTSTLGHSPVGRARSPLRAAERGPDGKQRATECAPYHQPRPPKLGRAVLCPPQTAVPVGTGAPRSARPTQSSDIRPTVGRAVLCAPQTAVPMETGAPRSARPTRPDAAFTMVEIALCIAIVAFALVAIIGVLPTGMRVQKDNREDTVINQDGTFWLEAIRSGSLGLDELTNYVESITVVSRGPGVGARENYAYGDGRRHSATNTFARGSNIIGLLTTPKYTYDSRRRLVTNLVTALVRSLSGTADLKPDPGKKQTVSIQASPREQPVELSVNDMAFKYRLTSEIVPLYLPFGPPRRLGADYLDWVRAREEANLSLNAYDVRLTLEWPVYPRQGSYIVGDNRKTFRTLVSASMIATNLDKYTTLFFFQPSTFVPAR